MPSPAASCPVELVEARGADLGAIENLMQFYNYELSRWYPIEFDASGLYAIRSKAAYWAEPGVRPFLIRADGELAGFAVVDDEVVDPVFDFNLGYFFVGRRHRGRGVGTAAFRALLQRFPGAWEIYHLALNEPARHFWPAALRQVQPRSLEAIEATIHGQASVLYRFTFPATPAPAS